MKKDLRSMMNSKPNNGNRDQVKAPQNKMDFSPEQISQAQDMMNKYSGKSQEQLMQDLIKETAAQKANGTFSSESLEQFYSTASGMLNREQRKNMRKLIDQLK